MKDNFTFKTGILSLVFLIALVNFSFIQTSRKPDIIVLKDNTKLEVLIQEVDENVVKYRKVSDPEGPVYSVRRTEIASIKYGNTETGTFDNAPENPERHPASTPEKVHR
ncbi:hypothetical protein FEM33_11395 [Dyadobacter flavalbus]|uniref:Uncharacterized protein n=1 Tax=Dyadobacter flavalbus TaxID=2579942 RepID=A0A5M8QY67_9BACT|nr:hypothetical protein [Dyadobacter flavalbus]KAA6439616.1 hypothetical protein FEM33_11395 [Dyadobacter flavalbus]